MNLLDLENISVRYGDVEVIRDLSLSVEEGSDHQSCWLEWIWKVKSS